MTPGPWDVPKVSAWDAPDASAWDVPDVGNWDVPDVAAFDGPVPEWPDVPGWDDAPVTAGDGLGDVSANMPSRTQLDGGTDDTSGGPAPDAVTPR